MALEGHCDLCERPLPTERVFTCGRSDCAAVARANYHGRVAKRQETNAQKPLGDELEIYLKRCGCPKTPIVDLRATTDGVAAMKAAREFIFVRLKLLLLVGRAGIGKTVAAAAVLKAAVERFPWNQGATASLILPAEFVHAHRLTTLSNFDNVDQEWIRHLHQVSLLVLDDAGDEASQFGRALVRSLVKERFEHGKRTVVTSNLTFDAFRDRYGAELLDRARESGLVPDLSHEKSLRRPAQRSFDDNDATEAP